MKIAMLARNANLYSHKRLQQAAEERGADCHSPGPGPGPGGALRGSAGKGAGGC